MTYLFSPLRPAAPHSPGILIEVARCWSQALESGKAIQPSLCRILTGHNVQILAPVFDSLMHFYQRALGRAFAVGTASDCTRDELQLVSIMNGSLERHACIVCTEEAASGLDRAISSARIMMKLATRD